MMKDKSMYRLIYYYISEFELNGEDRAQYGKNTIKLLAERLNHIKGIIQEDIFKTVIWRKALNNQITPEVTPEVKKLIEIMSGELSRIKIQKMK